nr:hypothetical protein [uncultured Holophaga sp.]
MTESREQRILAEILTRLDGDPLGPLSRPTGLTPCSRSHLRELAPGQLPHISIYPMESQTQRSGSISTTVLTVKMVLFAKGSGTTPMDADLDPLWLWVHQQLLADESLGALSIRIEPAQKVWGFNLAQAPFGDLDLHYLITYRHPSANPSL